MMAIKAARAYTGRDRIAKFEGAYHGYYDDVQVSYSSRPDDWGPDDAPASVPSSGGVPKHRVLETLILPWNDPDACERLLTRHAAELAAVLVDPLSNRMGFIPPAEGFLRVPPAAHPAARHPPRLRRGHLVPGRLPRRPGPLRRGSRPDRLRQDHRRGLPGRRHRRTRRGDGGVRPRTREAADRLRRHVQRQPGEHDGAGSRRCGR